MIIKYEKCGKEVDWLNRQDICRECANRLRYSRRREYFRDYRAKRKMQTVYIALCEDGGLYVGSTIDFYQRRKDHNNGVSLIPSKPLLYSYSEYPNLSTAERLELETCLILMIIPKHNKRLPVDGKISDKIRALGNEYLDKLYNGKLSVAL